MKTKKFAVEPYKELAMPLLRYGLALVFIYFGVSQLLDPYNFIGYLPTFLFLTDYAVWFVYANAIFELIASVFLILGIYVRPVAFLLALHLAAITFKLGLSMDGVRDFGLTIATFTVFLYGEDKWCLRKNKNNG
ncbi:MAG: DoxX family protein [Candidatus Woesearchaeota archaeon]